MDGESIGKVNLIEVLLQNIVLCFILMVHACILHAAVYSCSQMKRWQKVEH